MINLLLTDLLQTVRRAYAGI